MLSKDVYSKYESNVQTILILIGVYSIIPFLIISQSIYPAADDYGIAVKYSEHPFNYIFKDTYLNWSGRYFAILISAFDPINYKAYELYKFVPVIFIIAFVVTLFVTLSEFSKPYLNLKQRLAFTSLLTYLYLSAVPSSSEAFYWFPSACIYHLPNVLCLLLLIQLNRLQRSITNTSKSLYLLFAALVAIIIIGSNEISMFITLFSTLLYMVDSFNKRKNILWFFILLGIVLIASAFSLFAPGNFKRLQFFQLFTQSTLWTITGAGGITFFYVFQWTVVILISTIVYVPFLGIPIAEKYRSIGNNFRLKRIILLFPGLIIFLQVFTLWFAGGSNLGRIENVVYLLFLIGYFFCLQLYLNQLSQEKRKNISSNRLLIGIGIVAFIVNVFDLNNNITTAYIDLISGKAKRYHEELTERDVIVNNCKVDTCFVPALKDVPKTIFFTDIKALNEDDLNLWINQDYAAFMHRNYILSLSPLPPIKTNVQTLKEMGKTIRSNILK